MTQPGTRLPWCLGVADRMKPGSRIGTGLQDYTVKRQGEGFPGEVVAVVLHGKSEAEAANPVALADGNFIVHACNAFPKLVAALKEAADYIDRARTGEGMRSDILHKKLAALLRSIEEGR